ncbi:GGDEF domain-containing protein [Ligilactobacillus saerimneri]|uniref:GGDEF domain-containing protein n=1 Tax=Ligilactobacillus saerimneri TaxID=228229 RepID=UPI0024B16DCD|nr:GGDEF domain-containing protein [Ligilactobacillus saerimneri]MDI9206119.1 GGDEF domain-containing protein [Ligilactobacillus saerimneri]
MTGLGNYRSMLDYAEKEFSASTTGVVCVVDMDHFKRVNDQWGHESGNRALKIFADYLLTSWQQVFEGEARVFRYGGEEFCILVKDIDDSEFDKVIQKIRYYQYQFMQLPIYIQRDHMLSLTFSVGVARWHKGDDLKSAFERADEALYVAKNSGRSQVRVYSDIVGKIKNDNLERKAE